MKQLIITMIVASAILSPVFSEGTGDSALVLTVEKAVELGLENNLNLKVQASTAAGKKRSMDDAWNSFLPDVSASVTLNRSNSPAYGQAVSLWTASGSLSARLTLSPAMADGVKLLGLDYQDALLDLESAELGTERRIKSDFYRILLLEEQIVVLKKSIKTAEARCGSVRAMYENGYVTELDLLNAQAALSSLGPTLLKLENSYEQLKMAFMMELGIHFGQQVCFEGTVDAPRQTFDEDFLVNTCLTGRIDIRQLAVAEETLRSLKSAEFNRNMMPALVMGWSFSPYQMDPFSPDNWGTAGYFGDNGALSINMSLPIEDWFPHSASSNRIAEAQGNIDRLLYQKELAFLGAEMEIRSLVMNLNTSIETIKVHAESVEIKRRSREMSVESYNGGQLSLLDLEAAENALLQAELDLVSEKYGYISSLLSLEEAVNRKLLK